LENSIEKNGSSVNFATLITVACFNLSNFLLSTNLQADLVGHYLQGQQHEINEEERRLNQTLQENVQGLPL
jgi:hypothetical protein